MRNDKTYDVILLGSGLTSTSLAAILAKKGADVLIIEKGSHPRFVLGESLLPQTVAWMLLSGLRYDIPELVSLAHIDTITTDIKPTSGIKRSFGFVFHRDGEPYNTKEAQQFIPPRVPIFQESHLHRPDTDLYMLNAARKYGASYMDKTTVDNVEIDADGVSVRVNGETTFRGRYLIDGTGFNSQVVRDFGLREEPTRFKTQSRAIFTWMKGVKRYDDVIGPDLSPGQSEPYHAGTLHQIFAGGWFWIIPFNNISASVNDLTSVGVNLDVRKHPLREGVSPEDEFRSIVHRYPSIAAQFENAEAVQPWFSTGARQQVSASSSAGERYFVLNTAYGTIDALYSRGLISAYEVLFVLAQRLLDGLADDDLSFERMSDLDDLQRRQFDAHDAMVNNGYNAMSSFTAWQAWNRVWEVLTVFSEFWMVRNCFKAMSAEPDIWNKLDQSLLSGYTPYKEPFDKLFSLAGSGLEEMESGLITDQQFADRVFANLKGLDWLPHNVYEWGNPEVQHADMVDAKVAKLYDWVASGAPDWVREKLFDFPLDRPAVASSGLVEA